MLKCSKQHIYLLKFALPRGDQKSEFLSCFQMVRIAGIIFFLCSSFFAIIFFCIHYVNVWAQQISCHCFSMCNILQDISLFKNGDINKMTIQTKAYFKNSGDLNFIEPSFHLVKMQKGRPFTSVNSKRKTSAKGTNVWSSLLP